MSELLVGILGFACIVGIVVTLFKRKENPSGLLKTGGIFLLPDGGKVYRR